MTAGKYFFKIIFQCKRVFVFLLLFICNSFTKEMPGGMDALALLYFAKIQWLYVRTISICGYEYSQSISNPWIYPWICTENLWIWIWMTNFISTASLPVPRWRGKTDSVGRDLRPRVSF